MSGVPIFRSSGRAQPAPGHRGNSGTASSRTTNNMASVLQAVLAERRRRALYAGCDRAPEMGDEHREWIGRKP